MLYTRWGKRHYFVIHVLLQAGMLHTSSLQLNSPVWLVKRGLEAGSGQSQIKCQGATLGLSEPTITAATWVATEHMGAWYTFIDLDDAFCQSLCRARIKASVCSHEMACSGLWLYFCGESSHALQHANSGRARSGTSPATPRVLVIHSADQPSSPPA